MVTEASPYTSNGTEAGDSPSKPPFYADSRKAKVGHRIIFAKYIWQHRKTLFGEGSDTVAKEEAWKWIGEQVKDLSTFKDKTWMRLRDHEWQYIRRHAVTRYENKSFAPGQLGELDAIVMDCGATTRRVKPKHDMMPSESIHISQPSPSIHIEPSQPLYDDTIEVKNEMVDQREESMMDTLLASTHNINNTMNSMNGDEDIQEMEARQSFNNLLATLTNANNLKNTIEHASTSYISPQVDQSSTSNDDRRGIKRNKSDRTNEENGVDYRYDSEISCDETHEETMRRLQRKKLEIEIHMLEEEEKRKVEAHRLDMEYKRIRNEVLLRSSSQSSN